jgi:dephospho-CoA kinase
MHIPVIGIVGGIGSGKSVVAQALVQQGGWLISGDQLGHEALRQPDIKAQLVARWGVQVLDPNGEVERKRVAAIVFANPAERRALEAMTHPYIEGHIREKIAQARARSDVRFLVLDAAILLEAGWHKVCDHIIFVDSLRETRLERLKQKRGWSADEVNRRENAQMSLTDKRAHADAVVDNNAGPEDVDARIRELLGGWKIL